MKIRISNIDIYNFRSLKEVNLQLDETTILIGKNNCGKSNIIQAIEFAFSFFTVNKEDIFISPESPYDENKAIIIDVKIIPIDEKGIEKKTFSDEWTRAFGDSVSIDPQTDKEYFAFRTEIKYNTEKEQYVNNKRKIDNWSETVEKKIGSSIKRETLESIENISVNAQRDISLDLKDRKSIWGKLTSRIKVSDSVRDKIKGQLDELNKEILDESDILKSISEELKTSTADAESLIEISPITKDIESIYQGMNIYYTDENSSPIPVENLGLGVRSWAVFSTVKAEFSIKTKKANQDELAYYPLFLVEEPEAHVHPQAQRQLYSDIKGMIGQKIITTHSPYILSQVELEKIRYVKKNGAFTTVYPLLVDGLEQDDIRKIRRTVMNTRGEILYANAVILAEGETEEQAIPVFLREYFGKEPFELGINIIGVGGSNYLPYISILNRLQIKWYIFSDGEDRPLKDLRTCLQKLLPCEHSPDLSEWENVFYLESRHCFETYLLEQGYTPQINNAICKIENNPNSITDYINEHNTHKAKGGAVRNYKNDDDDGFHRAIKDCMTSAKAKYATAIAKEICAIEEKNKRIPQKLKDLFIKIANDLKAGGN